MGKKPAHEIREGDDLVVYWTHGFVQRFANHFKLYDIQQEGGDMEVITIKGMQDKIINAYARVHQCSYEEAHEDLIKTAIIYLAKEEPELLWQVLD